MSKQLREQYGSDRFVEVVRTTVFTSMREDTNTDTQRHRMVNDFYNSKFDVHRLVTSGHQEKCVDIGLAVEMLFMATIPDAYDIAGITQNYSVNSLFHINIVSILRSYSHRRQRFHARIS